MEVVGSSAISRNSLFQDRHFGDSLVLTLSHDARQPHGWAEDSLISVVEKVKDLVSPDALGHFIEDGNGDGRTALGSLASKCASRTASLAKCSVSMLSNSPRRAAAIACVNASPVDWES